MEQESVPKQRVLVVGASSGVGLATARRLAGQYQVLGWSRSEPEVNAALPPFGWRGVDIRNNRSVVEAFALEPEPFWSVIIAAGIARWGAVGTQDPAEWRDVIETNLFGAFNTLDGHWRVLHAHPRRVIVLGSDAAWFPRYDRSAYHTSKAALANFMESYRQETRPTGTLVTFVSPGKIDTPLVPRPAERSSVALRPEDIAECIAALLAVPDRVEIRALEISSASAPYGPAS